MTSTPPPTSAIIPSALEEPASIDKISSLELEALKSALREAYHGDKSLALHSGARKKRTLSKESQVALARFDDAADKIMKLTHPTTRFSKVFRCTLAFINANKIFSLRSLTKAEQEAYKHDCPDDVFQAYVALKKWLPDIDDIVQKLTKEGKQYINYLAARMQCSLSESRTQDLGNLKKSALQILSRALHALDPTNTIAIDFKAKELLGLVSPVTARYLVSRRHYDVVTTDHPTFLGKVRNGKVKLNPGDFPLGYYEDGINDPADPLKGLFMSPFLIEVACKVYTGSEFRGTYNGADDNICRLKGYMGKVEGFDEMTPGMFAYSCMVFLHLISAAKSWDKPDKMIDIEGMTNVVWTTLYKMRLTNPDYYNELATRFERKALGFDRHAARPLQTHNLTVEDRMSDGEDLDSCEPSDFDIIMQNLTQHSDPATSSFDFIPGPSSQDATPSEEDGPPELDGDEEHEATTSYRGQLKRRYRMPSLSDLSSARPADALPPAPASKNTAAPISSSAPTSVPDHSASASEDNQAASASNDPYPASTKKAEKKPRARKVTELTDDAPPLTKKSKTTKPKKKNAIDNNLALASQRDPTPSVASAPTVSNEPPSSSKGPATSMKIVLPATRPSGTKEQAEPAAKSTARRTTRRKK